MKRSKIYSLVALIIVISAIYNSNAVIEEELYIGTEEDEIDFSKTINLSQENDTKYIFEVSFETIEGDFSYSVRNLNKDSIRVRNFPNQQGTTTGNVTQMTEKEIRMEPKSSIIHSSFETYDCFDCVVVSQFEVLLNGSEEAEFVISFTASNLNEVSDGLLPLHIEFVVFALVLTPLVVKKIRQQQSHKE